ncbi:MAG: hypothetical protein HKM94_07370 [Halobacteria archaeon]|nr:hypothetical protein [Halobacteria archaeon]
MITKWIEQNQQAYDRHTQVIADLKAQTSVDFAMLSVVINAVGDLFSKAKRDI